MPGRTLDFHNAAPANNLPENADPKQVKIEFARRLQALLTARGWTQAEFAKAAETTTGREMPAYLVSNYIRGRSLPRPDVLADIAKTLGVETQQLLPHRGAPEVQRVITDLEVRGEPDGMAWVRLNRRVTRAAALEIMTVLQRHDDEMRRQGRTIELERAERDEE